MLEETDRPHSYDLSSIRLAVSAAEPLPAEIFRRWKERFGIEILDGIGSTEALHIYISARAGKVRPGSSGQPVRGYEVRIVDHAGHEVPPGTIGDVLVRGESTAPYYWNRRELTAERMRDGWFHTGDMYSVDAEGYYWYAGPFRRHVPGVRPMGFAGGSGERAGGTRRGARSGGGAV